MRPINPFAGYGTIVHGDHFLGRRAELAQLEARVLQESSSGNLAIMGEPKIGKSSLAWRAIMDRREELRSRRILPIWINMATYNNPRPFFQSIVERAYRELEECEWKAEKTDRAYARARSVFNAPWAEFKSELEWFFQMLNKDARVCFILDEFDAARTLFRGELAMFQELRELSYNPQTKVTWVVTSRRTISEIETQSGAISNLHLTFLDIFLRTFPAGELDEVYARFASAGLVLSVADRALLDQQAGGHPYLLDLLGFELVQSHLTGGTVNVEAVCHQLSPAFVTYYSDILNLLREDGRLAKLVQILVGPVYDVTQLDIDHFLRYGLIVPSVDQYRAYSSHFENYLRLESRRIELWPLWRDTEHGLRKRVTCYLLERYGEDWMSKLLKARPTLEKILSHCQRAQAKEMRAFGPCASTNLLDYSYPDDLFQIMRTEWKWFQPILKGDVKDWERDFQVLAKIRTPLAHNRDTSAYESERDKATGICKQILKRFEEHDAGEDPGPSAPLPPEAA